MIKEIKNGKNLEVNLPKYATEYMDCAYQHALLQLTLNYYTLYEIMLEEGAEQEEAKDIFEVIHHTIKIALFEPFHITNIDNTIQVLNKTREQVMQRMKILTYYTDIFEIYEYVLNRIEPCFKENNCVPDEEIFTQKLVQYIFSSKDNVIINERIREIIGQLPVRMTKAKFFELVKNSLSIYEGAEVSSVDSYIYMLRTSAMLESPDGIDLYFIKYKEQLKKLEQIDFKNLTIEEYHRAVNQVEIIAKEIRALVDLYVRLQEIINYLYVILLCMPYLNLHENKMIDTFCFVIQNLYYRFQSGTKEKIPEEITKELESAEGRQEELLEESTFLEAIFDEILGSYSTLIESMMLGTMFNRLFYVQKLLSSSIFIELEKEKKTEIADIQYIQKQTNTLLEEFNQLFHAHSIFVNRAVMAAVMNKMPVFFNSTEEVVNYISHSLEQCRDKNEKLAAMDLLNRIIGSVK